MYAIIIFLDHMTPVAGGITDRKEDRLVFQPCFFKSFITLGIPIHRILRMLQQVGTLFIFQMVVLHIYFSLFLLTTTLYSQG